jgi:hypothetical protein
VLEQVERLVADEHWKALESACLAMGSQEVVAWLDATDGWPQAHERWKALRTRLVAAGPTQPTLGPPLPKSPAAVATEVTRILDSFDKDPTFMSSDPRIDDLVRLGRPAMGALFEATRERRIGRTYARMAVLHALERMVTVDHLPVLAGMLANGDLAVGAALKRLPAEQVIPVLLDTVARGHLSFEMLETLKFFERDPRVVKALIAWLEGRVGPEASSLSGSVAESLARARATEAVPVLVLAMDSPYHAMNKRRLASAVTDLGDKRGIAALIDFFRFPDQDRRFFDEYERHVAGEDLNRVVGRTVYRGSYTSRGNSPRATAEGNYEEAAREFATWWDGAKATLRYDPESRAWFVRR